MKTKQLTVLLVDDDEIDAECVMRALSKARVANPVVRATDGMEALDLLRGENGCEKVEAPYVILLDMNMPRMNGQAFLSAMREHEEFRDTLVFVLTTSAHHGDHLAATCPDIAGYVVKDRVGPDFMDLMSKRDHFWRFVEVTEES